MPDGPLLTIAGFDPSSGAGVTADLAVFQAHGRFGLSCITALTVQSTLGVRAVHAIDASIVSATLACLEHDVPAAGVKIGMLATAANVHAVAGFLERRQGRGPVVLDPVLVSSSGRELLEPEGLEAMRDHLLGLVDWATPNRAELSALLGRTLAGEQELEEGARELAGSYPGLKLVVTGGDGERADDLLLDSSGVPQWLRAERIASDSTHGTGCAFSSSLLCGLVGGNPEPVQAAKEYVTEAIRRAVPMGRGKGPLRLDWPRRSGFEDRDPG